MFIYIHSNKKKPNQKKTPKTKKKKEGGRGGGGKETKEIKASILYTLHFIFHYKLSPPLYSPYCPFLKLFFSSLLSPFLQSD